MTNALTRCNNVVNYDDSIECTDMICQIENGDTQNQNQNENGVRNNSMANNKVLNCCYASTVPCDNDPIVQKNLTSQTNHQNPPNDLSKFTQNDVVNLSSHILTTDENSVLELGLNFFPAPGAPERGEIIKELHEFNRKVSIKCHFLNHPTPVSNQNPISLSGQPFHNTECLKAIKTKSSWAPSNIPQL